MCEILKQLQQFKMASGRKLHCSIVGFYTVTTDDYLCSN